MINVQVDRRRWLRGDYESFLLRPSDNKMCCLGFVCLELGASEDEIRGVAEPGNRDKLISLFPEDSSGILAIMMGANDLAFGGVRFSALNTTLPGYSWLAEFGDLSTFNDQERFAATKEKFLTEQAKQLGLELEFVN